MTRLSIVHKTAYKYNRRVTLSYNEARMTPLTDGQQVVLESSLKVSPNQGLGQHLPRLLGHARHCLRYADASREP
ncbi:hypothetical protein StoSoilB13_08050 [Arthrobacter sp. StoSoilB13]|nr:hypothetical protein StoSoilB13_08050 [Arthrobacter sp. StoSoilB13]